MKVGVYAYNLYLVLGPSNIDVLAEIVTFWMKETKNANLIKENSFLQLVITTINFYLKINK